LIWIHRSLFVCSAFLHELLGPESHPYGLAARLNFSTPGMDRQAAQGTLLGNEITLINLLGRRMAAAVLLVQALGGGWDVADLPSAQAVSKSPRDHRHAAPHTSHSVSAAWAPHASSAAI
jgi:hypothetical protein